MRIFQMKRASSTLVQRLIQGGLSAEKRNLRARRIWNELVPWLAQCGRLGRGNGHQRTVRVLKAHLDLDYAHAHERIHDPGLDVVDENDQTTFAAGGGDIFLPDAINALEAAQEFVLELPADGHEHFGVYAYYGSPLREPWLPAKGKVGRYVTTLGERRIVC